MPSKRRRPRKADPLANAAAVRRICEALRARCPSLIPNTEKQLISLLNAVRHVESYPATDSKSGRPTPWARADLLLVARELKAILSRETQGRISLSSFVGAYLRILHFPADIATALEAGKLTLQEANLLARIKAERLAVSPQQAKALRQQILTAHLQTNASQNGLRARVQSVLGEATAVVSTETMTGAVQKVDELLEIDPEDKRHLFFEEIRNLFYALREIESEDIDERTLEDFSEAADRLFTILHNIQKKRRQREKDARLLNI